MLDDLTLGEIGRSVTRIESAVRDLTNQVQAGIGPVSELRVRVTNVEDDIDALGKKVEDMKTRSDRLIGGIGLLAFLSSLVPWPWKR